MRSLIEIPDVTDIKVENPGPIIISRNKDLRRPQMY
jgi:hypothetical protein